MAIYTNLPIYRSTYALLLEVNKVVPNLSRDCRYTLGQDLNRCLIDVLLGVYRANRTRNKLPEIRAMSEMMQQVQVYFRLLCDMRKISERLYVMMIDHSVDICRQLSAWESSEKKKFGNGGCIIDDEKITSDDVCRNING